MTKQIYEQQTELLEANRQIDRRRRFTETVLSGVSSGVLGVNQEGKITLINNSASTLLSVEDEKHIIGKEITAVLPDISELLEKAYGRTGKITDGEIVFKTKEGPKRDFVVKIAIEMTEDEERGVVITFDDISELQSAQRKAAWSDVARRIAHEIKNPLTPIQLSAERLRRKYSDQISSEQDIFEQCTDTIIKHVEDIERMVSEFSSFARMPEPVLKSGNIVDDIQESLILYKQANSDIDITFTYDDGNAYQAFYDSRQIRQCLNNLIHNAIDSIHARQEQKAGDGHIHILLSHYAHDELAITICDNGLGFPKEESALRLTEPYVTHKEKGTGLGLAIVKKIMEDHKGELILGVTEWIKDIKDWNNLNGATVTLLIPINNLRIAA